MMNEQIEQDDGIFEAVLVKAPSSLVDLNQTLFDLTKRNRESRHLVYCRGRKFDFSSPDTIKWTLDGEFGGAYQNTHIVNHKRALSFVVSEQKTENS